MGVGVEGAFFLSLVLSLLRLNFIAFDVQRRDGMRTARQGGSAEGLGRAACFALGVLSSTSCSSTSCRNNDRNSSDASVYYSVQTCAVARHIV